MCTRVFWNANGVARTVARSMDWAVSDEPVLWFVPRGTTRDGHGDAPSLSWTSVHASVVVSMWGIGTVDGLNERGFAAHALYLEPEDVRFPDADGRPSIAHAMWVQYLLDHFSTVAEAVAAVRGLPISAPLLRGQQFGVHVALEDPSGDSAVLEPIDGRIVVHHGSRYTVMANSPSLDEQLENLTRYRSFGGELPPPGDITSPDRFVRAAYFLDHLPEPADVEEAVAGVFGVIGSVVVPYGAPYSDGGVYPTWWRAGADLTHRIYYFGSTRSPNVFWLELDALAEGSDVLALDPRDGGLVGEESGRLQRTALTY